MTWSGKTVCHIFEGGSEGSCAALQRVALHTYLILRVEVLCKRRHGCSQRALPFVVRLRLVRATTEFSAQDGL